MKRLAGIILLFCLLASAAFAWAEDVWEDLYILHSENAEEYGDVHLTFPLKSSIAHC